jgi:hypothetical protein
MNIKSTLSSQQGINIFYELLSIMEYDNVKMVCNPIQSAVS